MRRPGPKRNTWTYDAHGNVTADPQAGLSIEWNAIGLPRTITASSGTDTASTQRFYLADGSLAQVSDGTSTRLYLGDMVFEKAADGTVTLESAGWEGGRLLPGTGADKILYVVKDHLGSVRVVKDGTGAVRQRFDYYPYGTVSRMWTSSATADDSEKRYRFGGKEVAGSALTDLAGMGAAPGASYLDFGARLYSPRTAMWLSADPLMEEYYGIGPNVYCAGNPVKYIDPQGEIPIDTIWDLGNVLYDVSAAVVNHINGDTKAARSHWRDAAIDAGAMLVPYVPAGASKAVKVGKNGVNALDKASDTVRSFGKYIDVPNSKSIKEGGRFTKRQKRQILEENRRQNGGVIKSDHSGKILDPPTQSIKGQKANMNQAEIDHIEPRSKGGKNTSSNAQVLSKEENIKKGDKTNELH